MHEFKLKQNIVFYILAQRLGTMPIREPTNKCARYSYWELHYSRFWFGYRDWKPFAFSPVRDNNMYICMRVCAMTV